MGEEEEGRWRSTAATAQEEFLIRTQRKLGCVGSAKLRALRYRFTKPRYHPHPLRAKQFGQ